MSKALAPALRRGWVLSPPDLVAAVAHAERYADRGLHGLGHYRIDAATGPAQLVLGFGHLTESAVDRGIATIADLLG